MIIKTIGVLSVWVLVTNAAFAVNVSKEPTISAYIHQVAHQYNFNEQQLRQLFKKAQFDPAVIADISRPPGEVKPWYIYRDQFITPKRLQSGAAYWQKNSRALAAAEKKYGVPAEIIIGIIGEETSYGEVLGNFSALNALTTLAFRYPPRAKFFRNELTQFLLLSREQGWNPLNIKSSYAGALGKPQFMPSSYRRYAVNSGGKQNSNLFTDDADVIASIANYLSAKGWRTDFPIVVRAEAKNNNYQYLGHQNGALAFTVKELHKTYGIVPYRVAVNKKLPAGVLFMTDPTSTEIWMTFVNFHVIKKYNASSRYALVAYLLGNAVKKTAGIDVKTL